MPPDADPDAGLPRTVPTRPEPRESALRTRVPPESGLPGSAQQALLLPRASVQPGSEPSVLPEPGPALPGSVPQAWALRA